MFLATIELIFMIKYAVVAFIMHQMLKQNKGSEQKPVKRLINQILHKLTLNNQKLLMLPLRNLIEQKAKNHRKRKWHRASIIH